MQAVVEDLKLSGNNHFKNGNFVEALHDYGEALQVISKSRQPYDHTQIANVLRLNRAACFLKLEKYQSCIEDTSCVLSEEPSSIKALYRRACAFEKLGKYQESKRDLLLILNFEPSNKDAIALMRKINTTPVNSSRGLDKLLAELSGSNNNLETLTTCVEAIRAYCEDDVDKHTAFVKASGLQAIDNILFGHGSEVNDHDFLRLYQSCLRMLLATFQFQHLVELYVDANAEPVGKSFVVGGKVSLCSIALFGQSVAAVDCQTQVVLLIMTILRYIGSAPGDIGLSAESISEKDLTIEKQTITAISNFFIKALRSADPTLHQLACDSIGAFVSDIPNYCSYPHQIDIKLETLEQRKKRFFVNASAGLRAKYHSKCILHCHILDILMVQLDSTDSLIRLNSSACLGKILKSLDDESFAQTLLEPYLEPLDNDSFSDAKLVRFRATVLHCLLLTQPALGAWAFNERDGILLLNGLIGSQQSANINLASEIVCLAAGNEKASGNLESVVASGMLNNFLSCGDIATQAAGAAALAKLAIKAKALSEDSTENAVILNSATQVIKRSTVKDIKNSSIERAIEILASMINKSYIKQELTFGSHRVVPVLAELCALEVDERSSGAYGLSFIFSNLTVTNWELRALALAEKDISVEQYDKMMELQRIKAKDESGDPLEEKKEDTDTDTADLCKARIRKLVQCGGLKLIMKLADFSSEQTSMGAFRTLRQICVEESSRGVFIQQGGLKLCIDATLNEARSRSIRFEAAHAVAKSLVTTNPNLLSDSIRLSSIRPLLFLCQENESNDLQKFEALLAITNILSCGRSEQDKFVHEKGIQTLHYMVFNNNLMIRQAAVEALCNLSGHAETRKMLRKDDNIKLWLALIEEWVSDVEDGVASRTAKAAAGTLAMVSSDVDVANSMCKNDCIRTFIGVMQSKDVDMIHRILVTTVEMLNLNESEITAHIKNVEFLEAMSEIEENDAYSELIPEIIKLLSS